MRLFPYCLYSFKKQEYQQDLFKKKLPLKQKKLLNILKAGQQSFFLKD